MCRIIEGGFPVLKAFRRLREPLKEALITRIVNHSNEALITCLNVPDRREVAALAVGVRIYICLARKHRLCLQQ